MRVIWHLDLDCFYVSAERLRKAILKDRPVAVGGDGVRGVIASCSYEARKFGVRSAMPTAQALKRCPGLILLPPDFEYYSGLSARVFRILEEFTPIHEAVSIDEGYLDMTGTEALHGPPLEAARALKGRILAETGLTCSIGIASNRLVAKVATDFCKPDNVHWVEPGNEARFLAPLAIEKLPGCGKVTASWLRDRSVKTLRDLQEYPLDVLERHLGKFGLYLHEAALGRGSIEFNEEPKARSISREMTFDTDVGDRKELERQLWEMASDLGRQLRAEGVYGRVLRLKLRYPPFRTVTRARTLEAPEQGDRALFEAARALFEEHWEREPLRLIGVGFVLGERDRQLDLFEPREGARDEKLDRLRDEVRKRFGPNALKTGRDE
jgi:DNA polymerase-4